MPENQSTAVECVVASAAGEQRSLGHPRIGTEHLLLGLLDDRTREPAVLLSAAGVSLLAARHMVAEVVVPEPGSEPADDPDFTPRARRALDRAGRFARRDLASDVTDLHVLLGVLDVEGLACQVLRRLGVDLSRLRSAAFGDGALDLAHSTSRASTAAPADAIEVAAETVRGGARPTCHGCGASLDGTLTVTTIEAIDVGGRPVGLRVAHCGACGGTIGVLS
jgi:ATP-dependent Clp protease ATP-binding subunit ClpA